MHFGIRSLIVLTLLLGAATAAPCLLPAQEPPTLSATAQSTAQGTAGPRIQPRSSWLDGGMRADSAIARRDGAPQPEYRRPLFSARGAAIGGAIGCAVGAVATYASNSTDTRQRLVWSAVGCGIGGLPGAFFGSLFIP